MPIFSGTIYLIPQTPRDASESCPNSARILPSLPEDALGGGDDAEPQEDLDPAA